MNLLYVTRNFYFCEWNDTLVCLLSFLQFELEPLSLYPLDGGVDFRLQNVFSWQQRRKTDEFSTLDMIYLIQVWDAWGASLKFTLEYMWKTSKVVISFSKITVWFNWGYNKMLDLLLSNFWEFLQITELLMLNLVYGRWQRG